MTNHERKAGEDEKTKGYLKILRLIPPKLAQRLGLPIETPVFVSPYISNEGICDVCGEVYKPLVYQVGYLTEAHHFHEKDGGIYFKHRSSSPYGARIGYNWYIRHLEIPDLDSFLTGDTGWMARLEPIGPIIDESDQSRAPGIKITGIKAFCRGGGFQSRCSARELKKGFVFFDEKSGTLLPLCSLEEHPNRLSTIKFRFETTEEGEMFFTKSQ